LVTMSALRKPNTLKLALASVNYTDRDYLQ
jgi:hypothetical protein